MAADQTVLLAVMGLVSTLIGGMVWLIKRTFGHTIPRLAEDFRAALREERTLYQDELRFYRLESKEQRDRFLDELQRIHAQGHEDSVLLASRVEELTRKIESWPCIRTGACTAVEEHRQ